MQLSGSSGTPQQAPAPESPSVEVGHTLGSIHRLDFSGEATAADNERENSHSRSPTGERSDSPVRRRGRQLHSVLPMRGSETHVPSTAEVSASPAAGIPGTLRTLAPDGTLRDGSGHIIPQGSGSGEHYHGLAPASAAFSSEAAGAAISMSPAPDAPARGMHAQGKGGGISAASGDAARHNGLPPGIHEDAIAGMVEKNSKIDKKLIVKLTVLSKETLAAMRSETKMETRVNTAKRDLEQLVSGRIPNGTKPHALPFASKLWAKALPTAVASMTSDISGHNLPAAFPADATFEDAKRALCLHHLHMQKFLDLEVMKIQQAAFLAAAKKSISIEACQEALALTADEDNNARSKYDDMRDAESDAYTRNQHEASINKNR